MEATLKGGSPIFVDYTAGADVAAGEVIPNLGAALAGGVLIAHRPITNGATAGAAIQGGVYEADFDAAIAFGIEVFWNDTTNKITATATGNRRAGYVVKATSGAAKGLFFHQPA